jgi:hypothetical protein
MKKTKTKTTRERTRLRPMDVGLTLWAATRETAEPKRSDCYPCSGRAARQRPLAEEPGPGRELPVLEPANRR